LYFQRLVDTYPQSPHRADAKLGIGDAYLGEGRADSIVLAANEFREFLNFFPLNPRADYAQYKLAVAQMRQMLGPARDQTATRAALTELDRFLQNYPKSALRPEVEKLRRQARDRLSESEFRVGVFSYRETTAARCSGSRAS
jgi:outer membrane assembly lipoprotein YfiO